jgi:hypothetical protein
MPLTEINDDDLTKLQKLRLERFQRFFTSSLTRCITCIDSENRLVIHCAHPAIVDELLDDLEDLCSCAWLVLGVRSLNLFFCQEEVLFVTIQTNTSKQKTAREMPGRRFS